MLQKLQKRNKDHGFTIIEVLIVLAIAGLILLIVFLAVPALQRTARNTQRKHDASAIASAIANSIDNNGGTLPNQVGDDNTANTLYINNSTSGNHETATLGYYVTPATGAAGGSQFGLAIGKVFLTVTPAVAPTITAGTGTATATFVTPESVTIVTGWSCNASNTNLNTTAANPRSAAILYATETSGTSAALQCLEQ